MARSIVSLWIEAPSGEHADPLHRRDQLPESGSSAKAMRANIIAEVPGQRRHDRWKDKASGKWTGKVFVAVDPGEGHVRSKGMAEAAEAA